MKEMQKYNQMTKIELIKKVEELEALMNTFMGEKKSSELLSLPWVNSLGQWYWMVKSNKVYFNDKKILALGYQRDELPDELGYEFFTDMIHPEDYDNVMQSMRDHLRGLADSYEAEYRILKKNGRYIWFYDRGNIAERDSQGDPLSVAGSVFDITSNKDLEEELIVTNQKLKQMVITDDLTGIYNRRKIVSVIQQGITQNELSNYKFSIIMLDIDHFKRINDAFGHSMGDYVLKEISNQIKGVLRGIDIFGRWGGEEFIIILPNTPLQEAVLIAEKIRIQISSVKIEGVHQITASFGVTSIEDDDTLDSIINRSDNLMYKAKAEGRNCVKHK